MLKMILTLIFICVLWVLFSPEKESTESNSKRSGTSEVTNEDPTMSSQVTEIIGNGLFIGYVFVKEVFRQFFEAVNEHNNPSIETTNTETVVEPIIETKETKNE